MFYDIFENVFGRGGGGIMIELGSWEVFFVFFKKVGYVLFLKDKNYVWFRLKVIM